MLEIVGIVLSYAAIIGAFIFDLVKIRPIRNYYRSVVEGMSERKLVEVLEAAATKKDAKGKGKGDAEAPSAGSSGTKVAPAQKRPKKNQRSRR